MASINISALKFTWRGQWQTATLYKKNDIVQFGNAAYLCLQDIPDEWMLVQNNAWANSGNALSEIQFRDKRPDTDVQFWRIVVRGNSYKRGWAPHRVYQYGDIVRYGGDLYMYQGVPGQGAYATANINQQGNVVSITVNSAGSGYGPGTYVTIGNDGKTGSGATAYAVVAPTSKLLISAASKTNPVRITTTGNHNLTNGTVVTFPDINGMTQLTGQEYYVGVVNTTQVDLYWDSARTSGVDGTQFSAFIASNTSGYMHVTPFVSQIVLTNAGAGYTSAPTVTINPPTVRNTHPEDPTYWVRVFQNPNWDTRRLYAVQTCNAQPLGWTRNNGDYPNPQTSDQSMVSFIGADGVPYSQGAFGNQNNYYAAGRGLITWSNSWQPATFTFVDWLRSYDNQTSLGLTALTSGFLPTPDGQAPRCIQWVRSTYQSLFLMNNGEVYYSGYNSAQGQGGNSDTAQRSYTSRVTNNSTSGWLGETLPRSFNQTKIIKVDMPNIGQQNTGDVSCYALGSDGSMWSWGRNNYGQLGLGLQTTSAGSITGSQLLPQRIPAVYFDNKKIVDFMCFGNQTTSVLAIDEDGDLWGWGADYNGELGLGGQNGSNNFRAIPTRVPFDFKRYGGIKKMAYAHRDSTNNRFAVILTNDGNMFGAGAFPRNCAPLALINTTNSQTVYSRWTRYVTTATSAKIVENFWIVGDSFATNIFIRERDTGLTYGCGDNSQYTISGYSPTYNWYNSGGGLMPWTLVRGPKNIVHITNNEASSNTTSAPYAYLTIMMLDDQGRGWGQGYNQSGSLSLAFTGIVNEAAEQNNETGNFYGYQPIKVPSGARLTTFMGMGAPGTDLSLFITDDGQPLMAGYDGGANWNVQGSVNYAWYNTNASAQNATMPRYIMHSLVGD